MIAQNNVGNREERLSPERCTICADSKTNSENPDLVSNNLTEAELITRARGGDDAAWAELMQLHQQAVFRLAYLHLGDAADAEDAAQECFISAHRHLRGFDTSRPLRPWLLRIVSNLSSNQRRSDGRYWGALQRAARAEPVADNGIAARTETKQEANELWNAVKRLPSSMQSVIYLRYFLELSVEETSAALDIAEGTVKSQTHRALEKLQQVIRRDYPHLEQSE